MRRRFLSIALISRSDPDRYRWLARWIPHRQAYDLVSGRRLESESFRETIDREVGWQLGLSRERDYLVANMAQLNLEFVDTLPGELEPEHVAVSFYPVHLYGQAAWDHVDTDEQNRWITGRELTSGRTEDGKPLSPVTHYLLRRGDVIAGWR